MTTKHEARPKDQEPSTPKDQEPRTKNAVSSYLQLAATIFIDVTLSVPPTSL